MSIDRRVWLLQLTFFTPAATLLTSLNELLAALLIPITLSSLSLATPSLLLTVLESLLETRFETVSNEIRSSWQRVHRTEVAVFLVEAVAQVVQKADEGVAKHVRQVDVPSVVKGRAEAVSAIVDGLLVISRRMGMIGGLSKDDNSYTATLDDHSRASTPTPAPSRRGSGPSQTLLAAPRSSTPPLRSPSSLSTSSRVSLRHIVAISPPLASASTAAIPLTPRSQLRLQGLANALAAGQSKRDRPPLFVPPAPVSDHEIVRPVPRRGKSSFDVEDPFASRRIEVSDGDVLERKMGGRRDKGKAKEELCQCSVDGEEQMEDRSCAEATLVKQPRRTKQRRPPQPRYSDSSASDDPPPPVRPATQPATSALLPRQGRSRSAAPPRTSLPSRPAVQVQHVHSGYLSVVGESEVEAFERRSRRSRLAEVTSRDVRPASEVLEPPSGWKWVKVDDEGLTQGRGKAVAPETPSPYTLLLLSQRARLAEKLRDLKLTKMEQERGRPYLESDSEGGPAVAVRRRVERAGDWRSW